MDVQFIEIEKLIPYDNNPRINGDAVKQVAASIKEFGFQQPIVVDKNMVVIVGHTRLKAAKKLKLKQVPVIVADTLTEEQVNAYRLADNKVGELAKDLYDQAEASIRFAGERYNQDARYYDDVERLTHSLLNKDYSTAQKLINEIEADNIKRAGKKSRWYKYK